MIRRPPRPTRTAPRLPCTPLFRSCLLGRRVHAHRVVDAVLDRERQLAVVAVDRARRGVDQVLDAVVAAGLEDVHEADDVGVDVGVRVRSEEHTSELQSLMRISYAVFCLKKKKTIK